MRFVPLLISLGIWGLVGCGDSHYRLGRGATPAAGAGGDGAHGGLNAGGAAGAAGIGVDAGSMSAGGSANPGGTAGEGGSGPSGGSANSGGTAGTAAGGTAGTAVVGGSAGAATGGSAGTAAPPLTRDIVRVSSDALGYLAADEQHVFFTAEGVWRMDHSGAAREQLAPDRGGSITTDATHVYWSAGKDIRRVAKTGGAVEIVTTAQPGAENPAVPHWLAVDDTMLYAATYSPDRTVVRAPKTGGPAEVIARAANFVGTVDVSGGSLYWAEYASEGNAGGIHRIDLATDRTELLYPEGTRSLLTAGSDLWSVPAWTAGLVQVPLNGGAPKQRSAAYAGTMLASDGTHIYWTTMSELLRTNLATGLEELVAPMPLATHSSIAVTNKWVFAGAVYNGIFRVAKPSP